MSLSNIIFSLNPSAIDTPISSNDNSVRLADNIVLLNANQQGIPPSTKQSGIEIERGSYTNQQLIYDEASTRFKLGTIGALQCIATRSDDGSMINDGLAIWDSSLKKFETSSNLTFNGTTLVCDDIRNSSNHAVTYVAGNVTYGLLPFFGGTNSVLITNDDFYFDWTNNAFYFQNFTSTIISTDRIYIYSAAGDSIPYLDSNSELKADYANFSYNSTTHIASIKNIEATDVTISGTLTVNGTTTTVNSTTVNIADNMIVLNSNQTGVPSSLLVSGIEIERGSVENYRFQFNETDDSFSIGAISSLQKVATRQDAPIDTAIAYWNNSTFRLETHQDLKFDGTIFEIKNAGATSHKIYGAGSSYFNSSGQSAYFVINTNTQVGAASFQVGYISGKGAIPAPKVTNAQMAAISGASVSANKGVQVFNTDTNTPHFYDGTAWIPQNVSMTSGSFTPTSQNGDLTYSAQQGNYRFLSPSLCFCTIRLAWSACDQGSSNFEIAGFPYTTAYSTSVIVGYIAGVTVTTGLITYISTGGSNVKFRPFASGITPGSTILMSALRNSGGGEVNVSFTTITT